MGGAGGAGGNGGLVSVINSALLSTSGENAYGIFAQSVGGGGGGPATSERSCPTRSISGLASLGAAARGGDGAAVEVFSTGDIVTRGRRPARSSRRASAAVAGSPVASA